MNRSRRPVLAALLLAGATLLPACGTQARPGATTKDTPVTCGAAPAGIEPLYEAGALSVFGEVHGTNETPAFVDNVACHAVQAGREVAIGLEIPQRAQPLVDRFLDSPGGPDDVKTLLADPHWDTEFGVSSKAILSLIDHARERRRAGKKVRVFFFDVSAGDPGDRDQNMAAHIAAQVDPAGRAVTLILVGNYHARTNSETHMAWHLLHKFPQTRALDVAYAGGASYQCPSDSPVCGVRDGLGGEDRGPKPFVILFSQPDKNGYHGLFYVGGAVTASGLAKHDGPMRILPPSLHMQAQKAYQAKDFAGCAKLFVDVAAVAPAPGVAGALYNAACCDALAGHADAAFEHLTAALARGAKASDIEKETDLDTLHADPRWSALLAKAPTATPTKSSP